MRPLRLHLTTSATLLRPILDQARALRELEAKVKASLPPDFRDHIRVAAKRADTLFLIADSAPWRTRLHYLLPDLIAVSRTLPGLSDLRDIRVSVDRAPTVPVATTRPRPLKLSIIAAKDLGEAARSIADPDLRAALERLARRGR